MTSAGKGPPWEGYMVATPCWRIIRQLSMSWERFSAKTGSPGERRMGRLFMAMSPTTASPESSKTLIDLAV